MVQYEKSLAVITTVSFAKVPLSYHQYSFEKHPTAHQAAIRQTNLKISVMDAGRTTRGKREKKKNTGGIIAAMKFRSTPGYNQSLSRKHKSNGKTNKIGAAPETREINTGRARARHWRSESAS